MKTSTFLKNLKQICVSSILLLGTNAFSQNPIPTQGLISNWTFTGNANDVTGNGHNGTVTGATLSMDRFNQPNRAYTFDGNDWISVSNKTDLSFTNNIFTISFWINSNANTSDHGIYGKGSALGYEYLTRKVGSANTTFANQVLPSTWNSAGNQYPYVFNATAVNSNTVSTNDTWEHWVIMGSGMEISVFRNGALQYSFPAAVPSINMSNTSSAFTIGRGEDYNSYYYMNGEIDDFRIYGRVLNQQEITDLTNEGRIPPFDLGANTYLCEGNTLTLTAPTAPLGETYNYVWTKDGIVIPNSQPANELTITGSSTGNHTYAVTVTNSFGDTKSAVVTVDERARPVLNSTNVIQNPNPVCVGNNVTLTSTGMSYTQWGPSNNNTQGNTNPYTVQVTSSNQQIYWAIRDQFGCPNEGFYTIQTNTPTALITNGPKGSICSGSSIILNAQIVGTCTYSWYLNGILKGTGSSYTANTAGIYTLVVTNGQGCTASTTFDLTVNPLPAIPVITGGTFNCYSQTVSTLTTTAVANCTYQWANGSTNITNATSNSYTPPITNPVNTYNYNVTIIDANGCKSKSANKIYYVRPLPGIPSITTNPTPATICQGQSITLTSSVPSGVTAFSWYAGSASSQFATTNPVTVTPTSSTLYSVKVKNTYGCYTNSAQTLVTVNPNPTVSLASNTTNVCNGQSATLTATGSTPGTYQWFYNGTQMSVTTNPIQAFLSGSYTATLTDVKGCKGSSSPVTITVSTLNGVSITAMVTLTANTNSSTATYLWSNGATTQSIQVPLTAATYSVTVTDAAGCNYETCITLQGTSTCLQLRTLNNNNTKEEEPIITPSTFKTITSTIYPNPSKGTFKLQLQNEIEESATVVITDALGKVVYYGKNEKLIQGFNELSFDHLELNNGVYFVQIVGKDFKNTHRLVVSK